MDTTLSAILGAIGLLLTYVVRTYLLSKIKNQTVRDLLSSLGEIAKTAMLAVAQTYVDAIKGSSGALTDEQKQQAKKKAIDAAKKKLGEEGAKALQDFLGKSGTLEDILADEIEAQIKIHKKETASLVPASADSAKLSPPPDLSPAAPHDFGAAPADSSASSPDKKE